MKKLETPVVGISVDSVALVEMFRLAILIITRECIPDYGYLLMISKVIVAQLKQRHWYWDINSEPIWC